RAGVRFCSCGAVEVRQRLRPRRTRGQPPRRPRVQIRLLEMDPAVAPRETRLVGGVGKRVPRERDVVSRRDARLDTGAAGGERDGRFEAIAPGEEPEDLGTGRTEVAVPG